MSIRERLRALFGRSQPAISRRQPRVLVVVEGPFDIEFLRRISTILAAGLADVPDARGIATEEGELPDGPQCDLLLDAAAGLTRYEAESAFSLALVRHGRLIPDTVWDLKCQTLKKSGLMQLYRGSEDFSSLGGLASLKAFTKRVLLQPSRGNPLKRPRGVLLLSPPGCGKSQFCKCLDKETGRPVLMLDVGTLMGSLVGQTEERTRQALQIADAMAPCVLMIDEVFFVDFPGVEQKRAIWEIYLDLFEIDRDQTLPPDEHWTGAEIRACCRLSALLDVPLIQAAQNVVPVAVTSQESVTRLRDWATGRCLDAERGGIYANSQAKGKATSRRRVARNVSNN